MVSKKTRILLTIVKTSNKVTVLVKLIQGAVWISQLQL